MLYGAGAFASQECFSDQEHPSRKTCPLAVLRVLGKQIHWRPIEPLGGHAKLNKGGCLNGLPVRPVSRARQVRMAIRRRCSALHTTGHIRKVVMTRSLAQLQKRASICDLSRPPIESERPTWYRRATI